MSSAVLSESELATLAEVAEQFDHAEQSDGEYRLFDFSSREAGVLRQMTLLPSMHQRHAEQLGNILNRTFSSGFSVTSNEPRTKNYGDLLMSLPEEVGLLGVNIAPVRGLCYLAFPAALLSILVDRFFGGDPKAPVTVRKRKMLTPGEERISELLGQCVLDGMLPAWAERLALKPEPLVVLPNTDKLAAEPVDNKTLCLEFHLAVGDWEGEVCLAIPFAGIEPFKKQLAKVTSGSTPSLPSAWRETLEQEISGMPVVMSVELATLKMTLGEALKLHKGMVLPLDMQSSVSARVENHQIGRGEYGSHQGRKAIRINELHDSVEWGA
ncbi:MAG: flagellar motor switch protein FliM [Parahaliea sp.]